MPSVGSTDKGFIKNFGWGNLFDKSRLGEQKQDTFREEGCE